MGIVYDAIFNAACAGNPRLSGGGFTNPAVPVERKVAEIRNRVHDVLSELPEDMTVSEILHEIEDTPND